MNRQPYSSHFQVPQQKPSVPQVQKKVITIIDSPRAQVNPGVFQQKDSIISSNEGQHSREKLIDPTQSTIQIHDRNSKGSISPVNSDGLLNINTSSHDQTDLVQFEDNINGSGNFYSPYQMNLEELASNVCSHKLGGQLLKSSSPETLELQKKESAYLKQYEIKCETFVKDNYKDETIEKVRISLIEQRQDLKNITDVELNKFIYENSQSIMDDGTFHQTSDLNKRISAAGLLGNLSLAGRQRKNPVIRKFQIDQMIKKSAMEPQKLTNQFNENNSLLQAFRKGLERRIAQGMQNQLFAGLRTSNDQQVQRKNIGGGTPNYNNDSKSTIGDGINNAPDEVMEHTEFFKHFDQDDSHFITPKCLISKCLKLGGQRFILKQLYSETLDIQLFINEHVKKTGGVNKERVMNGERLIDYYDLIDNWMNISPQMPMQNFSPCYGIVRIRDSYYVINDLISDHKALPFQYADFSNPNPQKMLDVLLQNNLKTQLASGPGHKKIDKRFLYSNQVKFQDISQSYSSNMYQVVEAMNLGNLSLRKQVPDFYASFILRYIIQIARAFAHAHKNNLVHGVFNLTKVVAQIPPGFEKKAEKSPPLSPMGMRSLNDTPRGLKKEDFTVHEDKTPYNFILVNFEPWSVSKLIANFHNDPVLSERYKNLIESENLEMEHYLQIVKIQDLWRFGNSIMELLVCKSKEDLPDVMNIKERKRSNDKLKQSKKLQLSPQPQQVNINKKIDVKKAISKNNINFVDQAVERKKSVGQRNLKRVSTSVNLSQFGRPSTFGGQTLAERLKEKQAQCKDNQKVLLKPIAPARVSQETRTDLKDLIVKVTQDTKSATDLGKKEKEQKPFQGGISIDNIPLTWSKMPYINQLLEIISLCISPHQFNNNFSFSKTHEIFENIAQIALEQFQLRFMSKVGSLKIDPICYLDNKYFRDHQWPQKFQDRLRSSVLCNQGCMMFMTISDDTQSELRNNTLKQIYKQFTKALQLSPENLAARVNSILIEWQVGDLADEEFVLKLRNDITKYDQYCAQLLYVLFKKKIYGSEVRQEEMLEVIKNVYRNIKLVSNLTLELLQTPEIVEARENLKMWGILDTINEGALDQSAQQRLRLKQQKTLRQVYKESSKPHQNFSIEISDEKENIKPQGFFISNNDNYVGVIGQTEIWIIDSRTGKKIHKQDLPKVSKDDSRKTLRTQRMSNSQRDFGDPNSAQQQNTPNSGLQVEDERKNNTSETDSSFVTDSSGANQPITQPSKLLEGGQEGLQQQSLNEESKASSKQEKPRPMPSSNVTSGLSSPTSLSSALGSKLQIGVGQGNNSSVAGQSLQSTTHDNTKGSSQNNQASQQTINLPLESINSGAFQSMTISMNNLQSHRQQTAEEKIENRAQNSSSQQPHLIGGVTEISETRQGYNKSMHIDEGIPLVTKPSFNVQSDLIQIVESGEAAIAPHPESQPKVGLLAVNSLKTESWDNNAAEIQRIAEKDDLMIKYPSEWMCDIRNNGKMLAFYDKAQQIRNKNCTDELNKSEYLHVYQIILGQKVQNRDQIQRLDMMKLLDNQEVLNFSFDDFNHDFSRISVQAKDLYIYLIDYVNHQVLQKVDQDRQHVIMKSIFYDAIQNKDRNIKKYADIKEFVKNQEILGNQVLLPKANRQVIGIWKKQTNLIQIYSIKLRRIIRQFILQSDDLTFEEQNLHKLLNMGYHSMEQEQRDKQKVRKNDKIENPNFQNGLFSEAWELSDRLEDFQHYKQEKKSTMAALVKKSLKDKYDSCLDNLLEEVEWESKQKQKIKLLAISPKASIFVSHIGNEIFVKILNIQNDKDFSNMLQPSFSDLTPFMPIYQDKDYHSQLQIDMNLERENESSSATGQMKKIDLDIVRVKLQAIGQQPKISARENVEVKIDMSHINPGNVDRACHYLKQLQKFQGSLIVKNEKLQELLKFMNAITENPKRLFECNLRKKNRATKISAATQLIREFHALDDSCIKLESFKSLKPYFIYEQFMFNRSFETIKSFQSCTTTSKNYLSVLVNRQIQVYDFISGQLLFELNVPNAGAYCLKQGLNYKQPFQKIHILDNDQVVGIQDSKNRVLLYSINSQIEAFSQVNVKQIEKQLTFKIEKPIGQDIDIDSGFGNLAIKYNGVGNEKFTEISKHSDEDSEQQSASKATVRPLEFDQEIEGIFSSRNSSEYGYMAILGKTKFTIFYIQDDGEGGVDSQEIYTKDYKFDPKFKAMGQILNLDFEHDCTTFVTGTSLGWIQIWSLQNKCITKRFRTVQDIGKQIYVPNMVRVLNIGKAIISYSILTKQLVITSIIEPSSDTGEEQEDDPKNLDRSIKGQSGLPRSSKGNGPALLSKLQPQREEPAVKKDEIDCIETVNYKVFKKDTMKIAELGIVQSLHINRDQKHLIVVFQRHVQVYNIQNYEKDIKLVGEYGPYETSQIYIDDFCTYFAVLLKNQRQVSYHIFEWAYTCEKMHRPSLAPTAMSSVSPTTRKSSSLIKLPTLNPKATKLQDKSKGAEKDPKQRKTPRIKVLKALGSMFKKQDDKED